MSPTEVTWIGGPWDGVSWWVEDGTTVVRVTFDDEDGRQVTYPVEVGDDGRCRVIYGDGTGREGGEG